MLFKDFSEKFQTDACEAASWKFRQFQIQVKASLRSEEIDVVQCSEGDHQFFVWHGACAVNRMWPWKEFWSYGEVNLVGLPGHGPVKKCLTDEYLRWTPEHFIETGIATLKKLKRKKPVTLVGYSTGGMVALGVALKAPELVDRMLLISPVVWSDLRGMPRFLQWFSRRPDLCRRSISLIRAPAVFSSSILRFGLGMFASNPLKLVSNPTVREAAQDAHVDFLSTSSEAWTSTYRVLDQLDLRPLLQKSKLEIPTLILHSLDDKFAPFEQSQWLSEHLPESELKILKAGHLPFMEEEEKINRLFTNWLKKTSGKTFGHSRNIRPKRVQRRDVEHERTQ